MLEIAPFLMVVAIVAIISYSKTQRARYHAGGELAVRDPEEAERLLREVRQLRERVQVLERIVTDGDHTRSVALEREIEALRLDGQEGRP